jgi:hypothetical protein
MSVSRHHADWLSLLETSGPFLSLPVLLRAFPQGLDPRDPEQAKQVRLAYEDWQENPTLTAKQRSWVMHVLTQVLLYPKELLAEGQTLPPGLMATVAEYGEILRPEVALVGPIGRDVAGKPQLLVSVYPVEQSLDKPVAGKHWKATPGTRMMELLHATDVPLGLVTNGEEWMLVFAPRGDTTGFTSWHGSLWIDEPITLRAFHSLLSSRRFFGVAPSDTLLALLQESAQDQQEVTNQLGDQVRDAVEVLIQAFDRLDQDSGRTLLKGLDERSLYDAALTVMMRLVFLFSAEERGLLHLNEPLYDDNYAVSTLREQLQEVADRYGEEVLERRHDGWARLLASFRAVHGGVIHQDLMLPAYGGSLFDPDRYPFLEGRAQGSRWQSSPAAPLEINNRVVLHLLKSLQMLQVKVPGGGPAEALRVSFEGLNIEQIGHVYEGLLDHTAVRAEEVVLGLTGSRKNPVASMALAELEKLRQHDEAKLFEVLEEETGRTARALENVLNDGGEPEDFHKLLVACGQDKELAERVIPFRGLLRHDSFERFVVVLRGGIYVGQDSARRSTGTYYTPRSLTEPIVQHTLEPLVFGGPAEGLSKEQWELRSPKEILDLKVCDMAMGSGAFLVQACRYLSERLVEAWEKLEKEHPGEVLITPEGGFSQGEPSERLIPKEAVERLAIARRLVADRCLYGVDINPMAVEMAKLSIWLVTVNKSRPFTFLDHALKSGDSLLGVSSLEQVENFSLRPGERQITFSTANLFRYVEEASLKRRALEAMPSDDPNQIETKGRLLTEAEGATAKVKALADCLIALELKGADGDTYDHERTLAADQADLAMHKPLVEFQGYARAQLSQHLSFHWPLEFPEVFVCRGFDAFIGNPPYLGGARISGSLGDSYLSYLLATNPQAIGNADLSSYFLRRIVRLLRDDGVAGIITTNSIAKGETRESGLQYLIDSGVMLSRATKSLPWPGRANVFVSVIHAHKGAWVGSVVLDGKLVSGISSFLDSHHTEFKPYRLLSNLGIVFRGPTVGGEGFVLSAEETAAILAEAPNCGDVIRPFITGQDINQDSEQKSNRFVIDFGAMKEEDARGYGPCWERLASTVRLQRQGNKIKQRETYWWRFIGRQEKLYEAIKGFQTVLACGEVSKYWGVTWIDAHQVFAGKVVVFALAMDAYFTLLNSCFHVEWAEKTSSRLKGDPAYSLAETFETLPFPRILAATGVDVGLSLDDKALLQKINGVGRCCHEHRKNIMRERCEGLTSLYNRFHDPAEISDDIVRLRSFHVEMDQSVAAAYGWSDLTLDRGFCQTSGGMRFTISESTRHIVLDRLLALNHLRHEEEQNSVATATKVKSGSGNRRPHKKNVEKIMAQRDLY